MGVEVLRWFQRDLGGCGGPEMGIEGIGGYGESQMGVNGLGWVWRVSWN